MAFLTNVMYEHDDILMNLKKERIKQFSLKFSNK